MNSTLLPILVTVAVISTASIYSQDQQTRETETFQILGAKNLQEWIDKTARTSTDALPSNLSPDDLKPEAKKLKAAGDELFFKKNMPQEGIQKLLAAIKIDPRIPEAYNTIYLYYAMGQRDFPTALKHLEAGIKHCPKSSAVRCDLGNLYTQMSRPKDALEQFAIALELGVESRASVLYNIGNQYQTLGKVGDAIICYRGSLAIDEKHLGARRNLACCLGQSGDIESAKQELQLLSNMDPNGKQGAFAREALKHINKQ